MEYLHVPNGMQEKKKMDGRRKSLQADLSGCEWTELHLLVAVPCLARHRLPGTWAALDPKRQNQGALNPLELGEGSTDSKLLQAEGPLEGQPKEKKKKLRWELLGSGTRREHTICIARAGHR